MDHPDDVLRHLDIDERPGTFVYVSMPKADAALAEQAAAVVHEPEGVTYVVPADAPTCGSSPPARRHGPAMAWLTVAAHTSLEDVGLTAALATALAAHGVPCNVVAGAWHDHLLVPAERRAEAVAALLALRPKS